MYAYSTYPYTAHIHYLCDIRPWIGGVIQKEKKNPESALRGVKLKNKFRNIDSWQNIYLCNFINSQM